MGGQSMADIAAGRVWENTRPTTMKPGEVHEGVNIESAARRLRPSHPQPLMSVHSDRVHFLIDPENILTLEPATDDASWIICELPKIIRIFLEKNRKYAEVERGYNLGDKGIIPDINRKVGILVARLWHGADEVGESTDEVIDDLIGHLLLMKAKRRSLTAVAADVPTGTIIGKINLGP